MDIGNIGALLVVSTVLFISVGYSLGLGTRIREVYDDIVKYIRRVSVTAVVTVSLVVGAVILAIIASM